MPPVLYTADVVCPMTGPPLAHGGILVDGDQIVAVEPAERLRPKAVRTTAVAGVLLPGFVNAHTSLELSDAAHLAVPGPLHRWQAALEGTLRDWDDQGWSRSAHRGVLASLRSGATTVFDVVSRGPAVPAACRTGLTGDSWVEVTLVDVEHQDTVLAQIERAFTLPAQGRRIGIAPRAAHTLGTGVLQALGALARKHDVPLHVRAARTKAEVVAIRDGRGPLAQTARERGFEFEWLESGTGLDPIGYLAECGLLDARTTIAHGVWVDDDEAALLAASGTTVVVCPRADQRLQAGQAPLERYAAAGTRLAIGTDSAAATGDLDILAEAAAWVSVARDRGLSSWPAPGPALGPALGPGLGPAPDGQRSLAEQAVRLITVEGADAMGWEQTGMLAPGHRADFVGVDVATTPQNVYSDVIEHGPGRQVLTVLAGIRRSWRASGDDPWPQVDDSWRT